MNYWHLSKIRPMRLALAIMYRISPLRTRTCVICGRHSGGYLPYPSTEASRLMKVLAAVGSNLKAFECPWCGCHDRERHVFMYMTAAGFLPDLSGKSVLHFAPEKRLSGKIISASPQHYIMCDLFPKTAEVMKVDLLNTHFDEDSFDLLIANHVMEHVSDDSLALREIARVLKLGGFAILQTPFSAKLHDTWEDEGIDTDEARFEAYGQKDHVRLYGRDIFQRFSAHGLVSCAKNHHELLPGVDSIHFGINEMEPFFLFQKQLADAGARCNLAPHTQRKVGTPY